MNGSTLKLCDTALGVALGKVRFSAVRQRLLGLIDTTRHGTNRPRRPVGRTHGIEHRTTNALSGKALERHTTLAVETVRCFHEAEHTGSYQLATINVTREVHGGLNDHLLNERQELLDVVHS